MSLIQLANFTLSSGSKSSFKLVADQFIEENLEGLVHLIKHLVGPFSSVFGVPRGGLRLAEALKSFAGQDGLMLLVDDVLTSGRSMERLKQQVFGERVAPPCVGAVIFARGAVPSWIKAVFQLPEELFDL